MLDKNSQNISAQETAAPKIMGERFQAPMQNGAITGWRWPNAAKPPLLFCHATGFCASVYKKMLQILSSDFDVYALDMRGHGRTTLPADAAKLKSWQIYASDVGAFLDAQTRSGWVLAGHSMGAVTVTMAAQGRSDVAGLKLIEPVAPPPFFHFLAGTPLWPVLAQRISLVRKAASRRADWMSREAVLKAYGRKGLFSTWADGVLEDYLEDGLLDREDGVTLACAPAWESATFGAQANPFWPSVKAATAPMGVLAANDPSTTARDGARRRFRRVGADVTEIDGFTHLLPMENPALAAGFIAGKKAQ